NQRVSRRLIPWGWAVSFLGPILLLLTPARWLFDVDQLGGQQAAERGVEFGFGIVIFTLLCITLVVFVVSMSFGVQRACLRLKTLVPESSVPGLFLAAAAPVFALVLLPFFALVNQVASSPLLFLGMLLLMGSPLVYLFCARLFTRPLINPQDFSKV